MFHQEQHGSNRNDDENSFHDLSHLNVVLNSIHGIERRLIVTVLSY